MTGVQTCALPISKENMAHGLQLEGVQRRMIARKLFELGDTAEDIAKLFNVAPRRLELWGAKTVAVIGDKSGKSQKTTILPIKRGAENVSEMTEEQYAAHMQRDLGVSILKHIEQLAEWIENGWVDFEDAETKNAMKKLLKLLNQKSRMEK